MKTNSTLSNILCFSSIGAEPLIRRLSDTLAAMAQIRPATTFTTTEWLSDQTLFNSNLQDDPTCYFKLLFCRDTWQLTELGAKHHVGSNNRNSLFISDEPT